MGLGYVFAFADRSDHNIFSPDAVHVNGQLFLNIVNHAGSIVIPEPTTFWLAGGALVALALRLRRRA